MTSTIDVAHRVADADVRDVARASTSQQISPSQSGELQSVRQAGTSPTHSNSAPNFASLRQTSATAVVRSAESDPTAIRNSNDTATGNSRNDGLQRGNSRNSSLQRGGSGTSPTADRSRSSFRDELSSHASSIDSELLNENVYRMRMSRGMLWFLVGLYLTLAGATPLGVLIIIIALGYVGYNFNQMRLVFEKQEANRQRENNEAPRAVTIGRPVHMPPYSSDVASGTVTGTSATVTGTPATGGVARGTGGAARGTPVMGGAAAVSSLPNNSSTSSIVITNENGEEEVMYDPYATPSERGDAVSTNVSAGQILTTGQLPPSGNPSAPYASYISPEYNLASANRSSNPITASTITDTQRSESIIYMEVD